MSNKRYIELSSTYRNRKLYPNAADFSVQIADSGSTTDGTKAYNPLSKSYPFYNFTGAPSTAVRSGLLVGAVPPAGLGTTGTIGGAGAPDLNPFGNGFNLWDPMNHGPLQNDALQVVISSPYNTFGGGAGVQALQVYGDFKVSDALGFTTSLAYAQPEDDDNTVADSALLLNVGATYALMANTKLATQLQYVDFDQSGDASSFSAGLALYVNF